MNIFSKLKILDLTRVFSGPFATRHFAEYGAEVIKIEPPQGDDSRNFPPLIKDWSGYFEILNHNKKSLSLNLKNQTDLQTFYDLCQSADVIVENFSSEVKKKLWIDYDVIKKINPNIIYASISGISENVNRKYYDVIAQAESGLISLNGETGDMKISTSIVDAFSGMKLAYAIASALYAREIYKQGSQLYVSMKGSAFDLLEQNLIETAVTGMNPAKVGNMDNAIAPFGLFATKTKNIVLAIGNDSQWAIFMEFLKQHEYYFNPLDFSTNSLRIKNLAKLKELIESVFKEYTAEKIIELLNNQNIPCALVNTMVDVLTDQENYKNDLLEIVNHATAGQIVVSTGGIFFSNYKKEKYNQAPKFEQHGL